MKKFLLKISAYIIPIIIIHLILGSFADGNTDDNYLKFTSQSSNIIMGDSRGAQAVVSSVLKKNFSNKYFDNFSLNITQSPYGPAYFHAVQKKIKSNTKNGIFILTVDPWNLSASKNIRKEKELPEKGITPLENVHFYNLNPNYEYLLKNYTDTWYYIYRDRDRKGNRSNTFLHDDGWLEVTVDVSPNEVAKRIPEKIKLYQNLKAAQSKSEIRMNSFEETIKFLQHYGTVYIVRIPPSPAILEIENQYWNDFNKDMEAIAHNHNVKYFDFTPLSGTYTYTDGNHMYRESSKTFTQQIADSIKYFNKY